MAQAAIGPPSVLDAFQAGCTHISASDGEIILKKKKLIHTDLNNAIAVGAPSVYGMDKHQRNLTKMRSLEWREAAKITNPEKAKRYLAVLLSMVRCRMSDNAPGKSAD